MNINGIASMFVMAGAVAVIALVPSGAAAQALAPAPAPAGTWTPALAADGQPDVQGFWDAALTGTFDLTDPKTGGARLEEILSGSSRTPNPSRIVDPADGRIPYQPWAAARQKEISEHVEDPTEPWHVDTQARCLPGGVPRETFHSQFQIVQSSGYVVFLYEGNHTFRSIPLNGGPHAGGAVMLWMGDSRGHWEGNTLVVDVTNLNGRARMDMVGNFSSDRIHLVERYAFVDAKTMNYTVDIDDRDVYTRPWKIAAQMVRRDRPGYELWEDACHEGERSAERMILRGEAARKTPPK
jgi:hypothetical protein